METSAAVVTQAVRIAIQRPLLNVAFDVERWREHGYKLGRASQAMYWQIGDWLLAGERHFRERGPYDEAARITGLEFEYLYNIAWIVRKFPTSLRRDEELSWSHHKELAALDEKERIEFLDLAVQGKWSVATLREKLSCHKAKKFFETPEGKEVEKDVQRRAQEARDLMEELKQQKKRNRSQGASGEQNYRYLRIPFTSHDFKYIKKLAIARRTSPEALLHGIVRKYLESDIKAIMAEIKNAGPDVTVDPSGHVTYNPPRAWRAPARSQQANQPNES